MSKGVAGGILKGLVVGLCATQALDWLSIALYEAESSGRARRRPPFAETGTRTSARSKD